MANKIKKYITQLDVQFISLVKKGANKRTLIYKSADAKEEPNFERTLKILKSDEEKQLIYCAVYAPDEADAHNEGMTADEIEKAAHGFLAAARTQQVDKGHNEEAGEGVVVESFILKSADDRFPGEKEGAWVVAIKVTNEATWEEIKKGDITGISLSGECIKVDNPEAATKSLFEKAQKAFNQFLDALKPAEAEGLPVQKGFKDRLDERELRNAVSAFQDEAWSIIWDEKNSDKKASIKALIEEFKTYLDALDGTATKSFTPTQKQEKDTMSQESVKKEEQTPAVEQVSKADLTALKESIEALAVKVEAIEKAAPGRQTAEQREEATKELKKGILPIMD